MPNLFELVRTRHDGDGWIVFSELASSVGFNAKRTADAVALGVWQSNKYEAHLYEFKISREDLKRELRDPTKAEGVGKYCHYWWIVVDDAKRLNDLVIPDVWGILIAKKHGDGHRLVVHRKAPKLKPKDFTPGFVVSCIRNIRKGFVDPVEHNKVKGELDELKFGTPRVLTDEEKDEHEQLLKVSRELKQIKEHVARFEQESGVKLGAASWDWGPIGKAVKVVLELGERSHARGDIGASVYRLSEAAERMEDAAHALAKDAVALRSLMASRECPPHCQSRSGWGAGRCNCGANPLSEVERKLAADASLPSTSSSDCFVAAAPTAIALATESSPPALKQWAWKDDDEGGGSNSGRAGQDQQDAGGELRDIGDEVPNG